MTCQLRENIVTPTTTTLMALDTVLDSTEVNARCAPITSLLSRETSAPVWVRVKKASDIRWTCAKTLVRRSKISPSPIREDNQPISTPNVASTTCDDDHGEREQRDQTAVALADAVVDEVLDDQRVDDHDARRRPR